MRKSKSACERRAASVLVKAFLIFAHRKSTESIPSDAVDHFNEVTKSGINIAVIDTGIDWTHPMFVRSHPATLGITPSVAALNNNSNQK